jgi:hypothetical protein
MYSYTWNNTMSLVDPDGLAPNGLSGWYFGGNSGGPGASGECDPSLDSSCGPGDGSLAGLGIGSIGWSPTNNVAIPPYGDQGQFPNGFSNGNQGGNPIFHYSSLSRLMYAGNPETTQEGYVRPRRKRRGTTAASTQAIPAYVGGTSNTAVNYSAFDGLGRRWTLPGASRPVACDCGTKKNRGSRIGTVLPKC